MSRQFHDDEEHDYFYDHDLKCVQFHDDEELIISTIRHFHDDEEHDCFMIMK